MKKNDKVKLIITMVVLLFISVSVYLVLNNKKETYSAQTVPNDTRFDNMTFYNCIKDAVGSSGYDSDGIIYDAALEGLTSLDCHDRGIKSVKGIEYMINLSEINLSGNLLSSIDLANLNGLLNVNLNANVLTTIRNLSSENLIRLSADNNKISSIDLSNVPNLRILYLNGNKLQKINLTDNTKLVELYLNNNNILTNSTSVAALDLTNNTELKYLDASGNFIPSIDLSRNILLEEVRLNNNNLTNINTTANTNLKRLYLNNNKLTSVSLNSGLLELYVEDNEFDSLNLNSSSLQRLWCRNNHISTQPTICQSLGNGCRYGSNIITFESNGGSVVPISNVDDTVTEPKTPSKTGYNFSGWYEDSELTDEFDFDSEKVTGNKRLYAKWEAKQSSSSKPSASSVPTGRTSDTSSSSSGKSGIGKYSSSTSSKSSSKYANVRDLARDDEFCEDDDEYCEVNGVDDEYVEDYDDEYDDEYQNDEDSPQTGVPGVVAILTFAFGMLVFSYYYAGKLRREE